MNALILCLVVLLGASQFRVREAAQVLLNRLAEYDISAILIGEQHSDPEIRARCTMILRPWFARHAEELVDQQLPPGWTYFPWIGSVDAVNCSHSLTQMERDKYFYMAETGTATVSGNNRLPTHSEATRLWVRDRIANRLPYETQLRALAKQHTEYCRAAQWPVPPAWPGEPPALRGK